MHLQLISVVVPDYDLAIRFFVDPTRRSRNSRSAARQHGERSAGSGAAMRIAPLAFCCDPGDFDERRDLRDVCRITYKHDEAVAERSAA
tara:strand:+ start:78 stop:344 length:267 start_codon:yes stop_codon:yes gene_type:complete